MWRESAFRLGGFPHEPINQVVDQHALGIGAKAGFDAMPKRRQRDGADILTRGELPAVQSRSRFGAEHEVLAYMDFPREHWTQIASTNPLERVNREIKRRADVVGIFPNDGAIVRLVGALMLETNDEWAVARRYMSLETLARVTDNPNVRLPAVAV